MAEMTMRERLLAIVQGREHDRVPFVQYAGLAGPNAEIWSILGRQNMGILRWTAVHGIATPNCRRDSEEFERDGIRGVRTRLRTPAGELTQERLIEPTFGTSSIKQHFVKEPGDYAVLKAYLEDVVVLDNADGLRRVEEELGEDGLPHVSLGRTPYQALWVEWVSLENLCYHLADCPDTVHECVSLMVDKLRKIFEIVRKAPAPYVVFGDNITAPAIGVANFNRYCVPLYNELADMLSDRGIPVFVHTDGDLKPLWSAIGASGMGGLDSLSPPPDNDTSAGQAVSMWPHMRVFLNFPSSVHLAEPPVVRRCTEEILAEAGHSGRLSIQISENVPPGVWRSSFPEIVAAIADFGRP